MTQKARMTAMAVVHVFETGKPLGDYAAVSVLNDGAGISYGVNQFTHRSGSLRSVIDEYLKLGGCVGRRVFVERYRQLADTSALSVELLSADAAFKSALRAAAMTSEMRAAQDAIADGRYMARALAACAGSGFVLPLSLAVVLDSIVHGSYERIRDRVRITSPTTPSIAFERAWITAYVRERDAWLGSIPRLRSTRYRTRFFLEQIGVGRWHLELPLKVNGVAITDAIYQALPDATGSTRAAAGPVPTHVTTPPIQHLTTPHDENPQSAGPPLLDRIESRVDEAARTFDRVERVANTVINRTDRAKSLWTAVTGTLFQTLWAVIGVAAGLPREVWFFAAGVGAALSIMYLYRQIALGMLREQEQ